MYIISRKKIRQRDLKESALVVYLIAPERFAKLAEAQGFIISNVSDIINLANGVTEKRYKFNFKRLFRQMPLRASEIARAANEGLIKIV